MRILVTGSRNWGETEQELNILTAVLDTVFYGVPAGTVLVHGGAKGADTLAHEHWDIFMGEEFIEVHPADWKEFGKAAGPIRNREMVESGIDLCLAFIKEGSRGAEGCAKMAQDKGITTLIYRSQV